MTTRHLFFIAVVLVVLGLLFPHAAGFLLGIYPTPAGTATTYQLWSGFIPACAIISVVWPFVNCHVDGCARYGRYKTGEFRVCRSHHPDETVRVRGITHEHIVRLHREREKKGTPHEVRE